MAGRIAILCSLLLCIAAAAPAQAKRLLEIRDAPEPRHRQRIAGRRAKSTGRGATVVPDAALTA